MMIKSEFIGVAGFAKLHTVKGKRKIQVKQSQLKLLKKFKISPEQLVLMDQVHGTKIRIVKKRHGGSGFFGSGKIPSQTDGIITQERNLHLAISTADCVPVFLYDPTTHTIAALHAGFKGISKGLIPKAVRFMKITFGSKHSDILAYLGPAICQQCYSVAPDDSRIRTLPLHIRTKCIIRSKEDFQVDLRKIIRLQLMDEQIANRQIQQSIGCTFHMRKYPSHRREGKQRSKTIISVIGLV